MKENQVKRLWFFLSMFMFACLLLTGGRRLVVQVEPLDSDPAPLRAVQAYLCCTPYAHTQAQKQTQDRRTQSTAQAKPAAQAVHSVRSYQAEAYADSNGNVLRSESFMRSVYQSFDLGDGFV